MLKCAGSEAERAYRRTELLVKRREDLGRLFRERGAEALKLAAGHRLLPVPVSDRRDVIRHSGGKRVWKAVPA